jgi:hypothetical protein
MLVVGAVGSATAVMHSDDKARALAEEAGGWAGAWAGAKVLGAGGAFAGSFFPGPGTGIGGVVGGIGGALAGFWGGKKAAGAVVDWARNVFSSPSGSQDR